MALAWARVRLDHFLPVKATLKLCATVRVSGKRQPATKGVWMLMGARAVATPPMFQLSIQQVPGLMF